MQLFAGWLTLALVLLFSKQDVNTDLQLSFSPAPSSFTHASTEGHAVCCAEDTAMTGRPGPLPPPGPRGAGLLGRRLAQSLKCCPSRAAGGQDRASLTSTTRLGISVWKSLTSFPSGCELGRGPWWPSPPPRPRAQGTQSEALSI